MRRRFWMCLYGLGGVGIGVLLGGASENWRLAPESRIQLMSKVQASMIPIQSPTTPSSARSSQIMKFGFPTGSDIRVFEDFIVSYDRRNRVPHWVFEHLTPETLKRNNTIDRRQSEFHEDTAVHPSFRASNEDYFRSGYDRGHLAAAGNHMSTQKSYSETYQLSNIAPQVGEGFNRDGWNHLEQTIRALSTKYPNIYVCTGPLYLPRLEADGKYYTHYQVIGQNNVAVPTHFFKVVVLEDVNRQLELLSFVMPNSPLTKDVDLNQYMTPLDSVERASGLLFFDKISLTFTRINGKRVNGSKYYGK